MPKVEYVASLIRSIGAKDYTAARRLIEQMIAYERSANRERAATILENALRSWPNVIQMTELPHSIKNLVWPESTYRKLEELYLDEAIRVGIRKFIHERRNYDVIHEAGLPVRKSIFLAGPPGNGKTSLVSALAHELSLPFLSVKMHSLIDSHLGESSRNIGKVFEYAMMNDCLLFIDEFDAIGSQRIKAAENSGKEYNNIVTTLLTNMDRFPDSSVLVVATNMPDVIDPAIQRRFDLKAWLGNPSLVDIEKYILGYQSKHQINFKESTQTLAIKLESQPWSVVEQTCMELHKELILGEKAETGWIGKQTSLAI